MKSHSKTSCVLKRRTWNIGDEGRFAGQAEAKSLLTELRISRGDGDWNDTPRSRYSRIAALKLFDVVLFVQFNVLILLFMHLLDSFGHHDPSRLST